jgi:hypothetical protein
MLQTDTHTIGLVDLVVVPRSQRRIVASLPLDFHLEYATAVIEQLAGHVSSRLRLM